MSGGAVVELGCPGHLIVARWCQFRRHTQIGDAYRISTLGNYFPSGKNARDTIGAGDDSFFETMVFETTPTPAKDSDGCGCREVRNWSEVDGRRYATAGAAQAGHEQLVAEYRLRAAESERTTATHERADSKTETGL